jgi:hypothetical protein
MVLALVIGSVSVGFAQRPDDWAVDQAQQAVRERIISGEGGRDVTVRFGTDARVESPSDANLRVRGTGRVLRSHDRTSRSFSYEAVVNTRNSKVSDVHYDLRGDWSRSISNPLTGSYRLNRDRSDDAGKTAERAIRDLPRQEQQRLRTAIMRRIEAPDSLSIERDGRTVTIASSQARPVTFEADDRERVERVAQRSNREDDRRIVGRPIGRQDRRRSSDRLSSHIRADRQRPSTARHAAHHARRSARHRRGEKRLRQDIRRSSVRSRA